jgi:MFS family permease
MAQVAASTAAGLTLTSASVTAMEVSGSERIAGLAQTSIVLGASVLTLPISRLASRLGRRTSLGVAYGIAALGALVGAVAIPLNLWVMLLFGFACIGGGTVAGLAARFAAADAAKHRGGAATAIAFVLWSSTVGSIVGPNLIGLTGLGSSATAFLVISALYASATLVVLAAVPASLGNRESKTKKRTGIPGAVRVFSANPSAGMGLLVSSAVHVAMIALMAMAPVHLHHAMASTSVIGLVMSAHLAAMYILSPIFGLLVRHFGSRSAGSAGIAVSGFGAIVLASASDQGPWMFGIGLTVLGFGWSLGMVAGSTMVTQALSQDDRLSTQSSTDLVINLGGGAASVIAGTLVAGFGYEFLAWAIVGTLASAAVLIFVSRRSSV